jgi:hypothetical protein
VFITVSNYKVDQQYEKNQEEPRKPLFKTNTILVVRQKRAKNKELLRAVRKTKEKKKTSERSARDYVNKNARLVWRGLKTKNLCRHKHQIPHVPTKSI